MTNGIETTTVPRICPNCRKEYLLTLETSKYLRWARRLDNIQNIWPELTSEERERIQTGMCSDKCWKEYLGPRGSAGEMNESKRWDDENQEVRDEVAANLSKAEDALNEHCPDGFYVKIEE